jgi:predicted permease
MVWLFIAAAVSVLLIACANVGNLMLVRAAERRSEMAIRASLGAGRRRLLTQALMEAIVLATLAGVLGTVLSLVLVKLGLAVIPTAGFPSWLTFGLDLRILIFTVGLMALVTVAVGLTPAREGTRFDLVRALKAGGDAGTSSSGVTKRAQRGIVVQLSLSVVLFVGALLLVQTYRRLAVVDMGYAADEIVQLTPYFDAERYSNDTSTKHFASEVLAAVKPLVGPGRAAIRGIVDPEALSGIAAVAIPASGRRANLRPDVALVTDGDSARTRGVLRSLYPEPRYFAVSHEYFLTLGLKLIRGRAFAPDDAPASQKVVVVSRHFADAFWPRENPIGRTVQFGPHGTHVTVIGVIEDVRDVQGGPRGVHVSARPDAYFSAGQVKVWQPEILIHASGSVTALQREVQAMARRVDPEVSTTAYTMARAVETERFATRLFGSVIGGFAISGLILSIIGIYGVVAYGIAQRTREIGIRIALGGTSHDVLQLVLRQALRFVGVGLAAGVVLSLGASRLLRVLLFGVSATDPLTYGAVCIIFGGVGVLACYVPARRVTQINPLVALRTE